MPRIKKKSEMKKSVEILIGADPELFAFNSVGEPVSVYGILPGNKTQPMSVPRGAIQVDGIAGEFNINPAATRKEFLLNLRHVESLMARLLRQTHPELRLRAVPTVFLSREYLEQLPLEAKMLGCDPDFNAYTKDVQPKPEMSSLFRTGSGHVHIGWGADLDPMSAGHFTTCCELVKELDFVLYPASRVWDNDSHRMEMYGKPGSFRPKPYGVEYRVLSNAWLRQITTKAFVYDATKAVSEQFFKGFRPSEKFGKIPEPTWSAPEWNEYYDFLEAHKIPSIRNVTISAH